MGRVTAWTGRAEQPAAADCRNGPGPARPAALAEEVLACLPPRLRAALQRCLAAQGVGASRAAPWLEIRLRAGRPLGVVTAGGDLWVGPDGPVASPGTALVCTPGDIAAAVLLVTQASVYAWEDELAQGFCTLPGGHRAGLAGRALRRGGRVEGQRAFTSVCLRVARAVPGAADPLLRHLAGVWGTGVRAGPGLAGVLLFGPPGCGKTTLLRDLCRQVSAGRRDLGLAPRRVAVVDERCEIAACADGLPQFDVGPRTDVLDGWPKREGLLALVRGLGPEVVACDEIGGPGDALALAEAARCGVAVLATAHAGSAADLLRRPALRGALRVGTFRWAVELTPGREIAAVHELPAAAGTPGAPLRGRLGGGCRAARSRIAAEGLPGRPGPCPAPPRAGGPGPSGPAGPDGGEEAGPRWAP